MSYSIAQILSEAVANEATDIHLNPESPIMYRINGRLKAVDDKIMLAGEIDSIWKQMIDQEQQQALKEEGELDFAFSMDGYSRIRVNLYRQRGSYAMALRILSFTIPEPVSLGIPESVVELTQRQRGLILVTGVAGSGKSTTLASLVNVIAQNYSKNIITLEDPIEYVYQNTKSIVSQREIGPDTKSYATALRAALRQDPDVILVGDLRDLDTISTAITAAETGHLVFSTLHTDNAVSTIKRIIDVFPPHQQQQVRVQLSCVLEGIITRQLLSRQDCPGRVTAFEVMLATPPLRNLIRENKEHQIPALMQSSRQEGMQIMDDAIFDLYMKSYITAETAIYFSQDPESMSSKVMVI